MSDAAPVHAAFLTDADGNISAWNDGCAALFGLSATDILGRSMCSLLLDQCAPQHTAARWNELVEHGQDKELALELRCGAGKGFAATVSLSRTYDRERAFHAWVAAITPHLEADSSDAAVVGRTPLSTLVHLFPGTMYALNNDGRFVLWNRHLERVTEMTPDELRTTRVVDMVEFPERQHVAEALRKVLEEGQQVQFESQYVSRSGRETPFLLCGVRLICNQKRFLLGLALDTSARHAQEEKLRLRERALHASGNGIVITRCEGKDNPIEYVNPAFERISGYSAEEVIGRDSRFMAAPGMDLNERAQLREALRQRIPFNVVFRNLRKSGELFWNDLSITPVQNEHGEVDHFIGVLVDVTASKQRTDHLEHEVNHDALTGLANRNLLWDRLEQALHMAQRHKSLVAVVLIDLNNFKTINDSYGHEAGDVVLKVVAKRLLASVRDSDTVARLAGDEFVLVLVNQPSLRYTLRMIERLRAGLTMPVSFNHKEIPVGASVGVALYPHDGLSAADLVRSADVAMYHAKAGGENEIQFFSDELKASTEAKHRLESGMREALKRNELFVVYQPRIDLRTGRVVGFEALLRWRHPEHGVMLPAAFLPEAEENGCIVPIGSWVLDQACEFLAELRGLGYPDLPVTVNVSYREYSHRDFLATVTDCLNRHGLSSDRLQIELREDSLIRNPGLGRDLAAQLRELGLPLSVDDFGKGISDLGYLQSLAPRQLKLAGSAIQGITDGARIALTKSLIDIGHNLNIPVIGEAVETRAQMEFLKSNGCDQLQGIWFSEPLVPEAARQLLLEHA
jgi:diguanylate cyclase (GGDEF)-like protein/PAS domain S-box-containing protein